MVDVFISYSHKDQDWVRTVLLDRLEKHGFSVMIDYRDFQTGGFSVEEMQRGVLQSRHLLLVLTPAYISSNWTKFENVMAQTVDPGAVQRKLIPILLQTCNVPLRLSAISYRDLRTDDTDQWERLFRDLI
jgi:TIR domain-containing protein